jgi:pimeloyl-ACP methyl ester carboxylesterase
VRQLRAGWGTQEFSDQLLAQISSTLLGREGDRLWFANWLRVGASPEIAYQLNKAYFDSDLREVLAAIRVPTLVLSRGRVAEDEGARDPATIVPQARLVRLAGSDFWGTFLSPEIVDEIEQFVDALGEA